MHENSHEDIPQHKIEEQIRWEMGSVDDGIARYRASLRKRTDKGLIIDAPLIDTQPGTWIIDRLMPGLSAAIAQRQVETMKLLKGNGRGNSPFHKNVSAQWLLCLLKPEQYAYITLMIALCPVVKAELGGQHTPSMARAISHNVKLQIEWEQFKKASRKRKKEGLDEYDRAYWLEKQAKDISPARIIRWREKIEEFQTVVWTPTERLQLGAILLDLAVINGMGFFEITTRRHEGKTWQVLNISTEAREEIERSHAHLELSNPHLRPTLIPPKPWVPIIEEEKTI